MSETTVEPRHGSFIDRYGRVITLVIGAIAIGIILVAFANAAGARGEFDGQKRVEATCQQTARVFVCVPAESPKGSNVALIRKDGSARYVDGSEFSARDKMFHKG